MPQKFPADAEFQPYDDISWSLPVHYGLSAVRIDDEAVRQVAAETLSADVAVEGRVSGAGSVFLVKDTGQEALMAARCRLSRFEVSVAEASFTSGGTEYPPGSWIVPAQPGVEQALADVARELAIDVTSAAALPSVARHPAPMPRLAVWHTWADTQDVGWIRLTLDRQKIPYTYIRDDDIKAGGLAQAVRRHPVRPHRTRLARTDSRPRPEVRAAALTRARRSIRATVSPTHPTTSPAGSAGPAWRTSSATSMKAACW